MRPEIITLFLFLSCSSIFGQYSPIEPEELSTENYTRQEIREYLLRVEPAGSEIHSFAKSSEQYDSRSRVKYITGSIFVILGIIPLMRGIQLQNSGSPEFQEGLQIAGAYVISTLSFGIGGFAILYGITDSMESRYKLDRAIDLYRNK